MAVDNSANAISSFDPTGGASAWTGASPYSAEPASAGFAGVSCPSRSLCAAVDAYAADVVTWNPISSSSGMTYAQVGLNTGGTWGIWCESVSLCFATDASRHLLASTTPTGGASAWKVTYADPSGPVTGLSCPLAVLCFAVDGINVIVGGRPPTAARIRAMLLNELVPTGRAATIGAQLKSGGYSFLANAPSAGLLTVSWYSVPRDAHVAGRRAQPVLVGTGAAAFVEAGPGTLRVALTRAGVRLLTKASRVSLAVTGSFTPAAGSVVRITRTFTLAR